MPVSLGLPRWAEAGLSASVASELLARSGTALERVVFGIVDLETTGLSPTHCRILEIGAVALQGGCVRGTFGTLVDVGGPVPSGITALTGIDDASLEGAPCEGSALEAFAAFLAEHRVDVLVAHNARFDRGFLARAWREHGRRPRFPSSCARCASRAGSCARSATASTRSSRTCRFPSARATARSATRR